MEIAILPLLREHSPDAFDRHSRNLIAAYYTLVNPERMKG